MFVSADAYLSFKGKFTKLQAQKLGMFQLIQLPKKTNQRHFKNSCLFCVFCFMSHWEAIFPNTEYFANPEEI